MRRTSFAAAFAILALAAFPGAPSWGQDVGPMRPPGSAPPPSQQQANPIPRSPQTLKSEVNLVNVFVTVRSKDHSIVTGLTKDDFKVFENGVEQKVEFFSRETNVPITLAMLMDTSGSMYRILPAEKDAAARFVREVLRKRDEAMVMSFDTDVDLLADFTEDPSVLDEGIQRAQINVDASGIGGTAGTIPSQGGGTNLYDAVYLACHDQLGQEAGRKALVILSDAEDNGSKMSENDAIESAQRADAVIHFLLIRDFGAIEGYGGGVASKMAEQTGGRVIDIHGEKSLDKAFDELTEELHSQYLLAYTPTNDKRDGTYRKIQVEVDKPDAKLLARKGYYAPWH
ncbi:MAG TPA: VWA domain-containing protein [Candidatus Acidoferrum sp.]|nr:VWA domain-containing protein [Candidatus Acidoferrum sp.]